MKVTKGLSEPSNEYVVEQFIHDVRRTVYRAMPYSCLGSSMDIGRVTLDLQIFFLGKSTISSKRVSLGLLRDVFMGDLYHAYVRDFATELIQPLFDLRVKPVDLDEELRRDMGKPLTEGKERRRIGKPPSTPRPSVRPQGESGE